MAYPKAILYLEDGTVFTGISAGAAGETAGKLIFNTSATGYLELLTDPSSLGKIIAMTYPLQGNYGVNLNDAESGRPWANGFIMRELCEKPSNWQSKMSLGEYLLSNNIVAMYDIDTRALALHIRENGSMAALISTVDQDIDSLKKRIKAIGFTDKNLVSKVSADRPYTLGEGRFHAAVLDLGVKKSTLQELLKRDMRITVLPYDTAASQIKDINPDGLFISSGPGNPGDVKTVSETVKALAGHLPVCGIDLGHLVIGLAFGMGYKRLKFGHHGTNHPVKDISRDCVYITGHNHDYTLENKTDTRIEITHISVNDETVEGIRHMDYPIFSVQYHPLPSQKNGCIFFDRFADTMHNQKDLRG